MIGVLNGSTGQTEWIEQLGPELGLSTQSILVRQIDNGDLAFALRSGLGGALRYSTDGQRHWATVVAPQPGDNQPNLMAAHISDIGNATLAAIGQLPGFLRYIAASRLQSNGGLGWTYFSEAESERQRWLPPPRPLAVYREGTAFVLVLVYDSSPDGPMYDYLLRLSPEGMVEWQRRYDHLGYYGEGAIALAKEGGLYLRGMSDYDYYNRRPVLAKVDEATGEMVWLRQLDPPAPNEPYYFNREPYIDHRGDIYVVGATNRFQGPPEEENRIDLRWMIYKYHPDGTLVWRHWLNEIQQALPVWVALDGQDNMYVLPNFTRGDLRHAFKFRFYPVRREGDLNGDGCVDDKDLALMLELYGTDDPAGDANEDGIVDDADLSIAFKYFGYGCR